MKRYHSVPTLNMDVFSIFIVGLLTGLHAILSFRIYSLTKRVDELYEFIAYQGDGSPECCKDATPDAPSSGNQ